MAQVQLSARRSRKSQPGRDKARQHPDRAPRFRLALGAVIGACGGVAGGGVFGVVFGIGAAPGAARGVVAGRKCLGLRCFGGAGIGSEDRCSIH